MCKVIEIPTLVEDGTTKSIPCIKMTPEDCFSFGGLCICDLCNKLVGSGDFLYMSPLLGQKALCYDCFEHHKSFGKYYYQEEQFYSYSVEGFRDF